MEKGNLEKFIDEHRSEFDAENPSQDVWSTVSKNLSPVKSLHWIWKVAAVFFLCTTIYLSVDKLAMKDDLIAPHEQVSDDFSDIENYYFQIISQKRELVYDYDSINKPIEVDFEQDLQKLDAMYQVLKDELKSNHSKKVIDALILNLLVRIDVLNEKIEQLETSEEKTKDDMKENEVLV